MIYLPVFPSIFTSNTIDRYRQNINLSLMYLPDQEVEPGSPLENSIGACNAFQNFTPSASASNSISLQGFIETWIDQTESAHTEATLISLKRKRSPESPAEAPDRVSLRCNQSCGSLQGPIDSMSPEAQEVSQSALNAPRAAADMNSAPCYPPLNRLHDDATLYTNALE